MKSAYYIGMGIAKLNFQVFGATKEKTSENGEIHECFAGHLRNCSFFANANAFGARWVVTSLRSQ